MLIKRLFDIICSFLGLVILTPLFIVIAIIIKTTSHGPVFFRQNRVGKYAKIFSIYKFRTMTHNNIGSEITIGRDIRITPIGHILRKTKLDELPQLINVVMGDMSLVGPRPEVPKYVEMYSDDIKKVVLSIRPGITDWASILMIDESTLLANSSDPENSYINVIMPKKLAFAVKYVKTRTFWQDCVIIFTTLKNICR